MPLKKEGKGKTKNRAESQPLRPPFILERLKTLFEKEQVPFRVIAHPKAYTASEVAESMHVSGRKVVKVVIVRADESDFMAILPSHRQIHLGRLSEISGQNQITLESESALKKRFPDCEVGTMPPFGGLYGLPVYCDTDLAKETVIYFQAGTHHDVMEIRMKDYLRIAQPTMCHFATEGVKKASGF